jgi:hypothetical protein
MRHYLFNDYAPEESELLLMSDVSGTSFDGCYFGMVGMGQIRKAIWSVITSDRKPPNFSYFLWMRLANASLEGQG